jgi:hypothetical protein
MLDIGGNNAGTDADLAGMTRGGDDRGPISIKRNFAVIGLGENRTRAIKQDAGRRARPATGRRSVLVVELFQRASLCLAQPM